MAKVSIEDVKAYLGTKEPPAPATKRLDTGISLTRGELEQKLAAKAAEDAKNLFPQPEEDQNIKILKAAAFPFQNAALGLASAGEDIGDFALGAGQQMLGVPIENRMTLGDIGRKFPGAEQSMTASEFLNSPAYRMQAAANPGLGGVGIASQLAGG